MYRPVLTRFETTLLKDKAPGDNIQVPFSYAQVDYYRQGATAVNAVTIPAGLSAGTIDISDPGDLIAGDVIEVDLGGPRLTVTSVPAPNSPGPPSLGVQNFLGAPQVVVLAGARLIVITRRPNVFSDPVGTVPLGSSAVADANGYFAVYVSQPRFDYVVRPIAVLAATPATLNGGDMLQWNHVGPAGQNIVLVAVSWLAPAIGDGIQSVTYDGLDMTLVGTPSTYLSIYRRDSPPAGTKQVKVTFAPSPGAVVNAVCAAVSLSNVDLTLAPGFQAASGTSNAPQVTVGGTTTNGMVIDALAVAGSVIQTPGVGQQQRWNAGAGSNPWVVSGAGSSMPGAVGSTTLKWTLSTSKEWNLAGVELKALTGTPPARLVPDAQGGTQPSPSWINALDYPNDLQGAINALPPEGGEVFLPAGIYNVSAALLVSKDNVTIRGEGNFATRIQSSGSDPSFDIVTVTKAGCRFYNLEIFGQSTAPGNSSCLVFSDSAVADCYLENVTLRRAGKYGLYVKDITSLVAVNCECVENKNTGLRIYRSNTLSPAPWKIRFIGCASTGNQGKGVEIEVDPLQAEVDKGDSITLLGCSMESNHGGLTSSEGNGLQVKRSGGVQVLGCYFERNVDAAEGHAEQFIYASEAPAILVEGCWLDGGPTAASSANRGARFANSSWARFTNNVGWRLASTGGELVLFDASTKKAVELGNREVEGSQARMTVDGSAFGLSNGGMQVFSYATDPGSLGLGAAEGALIWLEAPAPPKVKGLYVRKDNDWKKITTV